MSEYVASTASESNVLVVAPLKALLVACSIVMMELSLSAVSPWLLLRMRTTPQQRKELAQLSRSIASLRAASNKLNSPATFAEYSKVQRTLNHELKRQQQLQADVASGGSMGPAAQPIMQAQQFALSYGIKVRCMSRHCSTRDAAVHSLTRMLSVHCSFADARLFDLLPVLRRQHDLHRARAWLDGSSRVHTIEIRRWRGRNHSVARHLLVRRSVAQIKGANRRRRIRVSSAQPRAHSQRSFF